VPSQPLVLRQPPIHPANNQPYRASEIPRRFPLATTLAPHDPPLSHAHGGSSLPVPRPPIASPSARTIHPPRPVKHGSTVPGQAPVSESRIRRQCDGHAGGAALVLLQATALERTNGAAYIHMPVSELGRNFWSKLGGRAEHTVCVYGHGHRSCSRTKQLSVCIYIKKKARDRKQATGPSPLPPTHPILPYRTCLRAVLLPIRDRCDYTRVHAVASHAGWPIGKFEPPRQ
jgi:hypothetical protein